MKAQRRHDLQTNTLVERMNEIVEYVQSKSQVILLALVAVVLVIAVTMYVRHSAQVRRIEGWQAMLQLLSTSKQQDPSVLDKMGQLAARYSDPRLKAMAYAQLGNRLLDEAYVADKPETAKSYTQGAEDAFKAIMSATPDQVVPVAIARMGLGTIAADSGNVAAAKQYYEAVGNDDRLAGTPFPGQATVALTALEAAGKLPALAPTSQPTATAAAEAQPAGK
jgi:hypothetical protein